jgi:Na+/proline symporter
MRFLVVYFGLPIAMVILSATLLPFYDRARVFTAYEFLEQRFAWHTRALTSLLFLVSRGLAVGVTLYAPSLVLSVLLGWDERATIYAMGGTTVLYVLYGGNRSVIWTDVVQMVIIWVGIFACVGIAVRSLPETLSLPSALALAQAAGRLNALDPSPSLTAPYTLWEGLLAGTFLALSYFGCDQSQVQRYLAGSNLRESRLSLLFNAALKIPMQFLILFTGVLVFVFYHFHPVPLLWNPGELRRLQQEMSADERSRLENDFASAHEARRQAALALLAAGEAGRPAAEVAYREAESRFARARGPAVEHVERARGKYNDTNYIFLTYVLAHLPDGLKGLVIAVIFAAAMSTLAGEFNALASATMIDFAKRFFAPPPRFDLVLARLFTAFWGGVACLVALQAGAHGSVIELVNRYGSYFYGSILGVFGLGVLTSRATGLGATLGLLAGMAAVAAVASFTSVHFLWYNVVGATVVFSVGLLVSSLRTRLAR